MFNRLIIAPGDAFNLGGPAGGRLLLAPSGKSPGAMSLNDLLNRVWSLLRVPGPDLGSPAPQNGDFSQAVVTRDLNLAMAQFVSATGIAPQLTDRRVDLPVLPVLDYPLPPDCVGLQHIEYTPAGQQLYTLTGMSFEGFNNTFGQLLPSDTGQPYYYRRPFAGYVRLQPQPGLGNAVGPGIGTITLVGAPTVGQHVTATLVNGTQSVTTLPYIVQPSDTLGTIAFALSSAINQSAAVTGPAAFMAPPSPVSNQIQLAALLAPGTAITYLVTITGSGLAGSPNTATNLGPNGDTITFYYSSLGMILTFPGDTPYLPPQFHMALVYRVLADYWLIKQDAMQAKSYADRFSAAVKEAKAYESDADRSTQFEIGISDEGAWSRTGW